MILGFKVTFFRLKIGHLTPKMIDLSRCFILQYSYLISLGGDYEQSA
jgi:hypothetical protein